MSEFYSGKGKNLTSHKLSDQPPFPGGKMNNIFWLVQVSFELLSSNLLHLHSSHFSDFTVTFAILLSWYSPSLQFRTSFRS